MVSPIEEGTKKAAAREQQSKLFNLTDLAATGTGTSIGATLGAVPGLILKDPMLTKLGAGVGAGVGTLGGAVVRRTVQPRIHSTLAGLLDLGSKALGMEYAKPLKALAATGVVSVPKLAQMMESAEGRGTLKFMLKEVADAPPNQKAISPPGAIERLKRRNKKGN